jgi:ferredoxin
MEKVKVNDDACIGCGACTAIASDVFSFNDDGLAEANEETNTIDTMEEDLKNDVMDALEGCPTNAIYKEEAE